MTQVCKFTSDKSAMQKKKQKKNIFLKDVNSRVSCVAKLGPVGYNLKVLKIKWYIHIFISEKLP